VQKLINGLDIRIIHATTGQIIRELILNPAVPKTGSRCRLSGTWAACGKAMPWSISVARRAVRPWPCSTVMSSTGILFHGSPLS
jgi:hypothetical protein